MPPNQAPPAVGPSTAVPSPRTISTDKLLGEQRTLQIDHKGAIYTLRTTSKGGLILTK